MALKVPTLKCAFSTKGCTLVSLCRWTHAIAQPPPLDTTVAHSIDASPTLFLREHQNKNGIGDAFPNCSIFGGPMELMAVPKRKVSPHKRGIRNGPKALKPVPVIIRCKVCGQVKLPHFFCCSGIKPNPSEHNG
ncbi:ribosomal L32 [Olea europaea subsp. europaea]|uniref:Large ribosomal subunit protein bL32m n=2 Tax=Olea europaea subsp. europaea TaxID=158383 RepID=A0A8S0R9P9_OLEEU|nr:ribosomal L32 [Olea europaea subsp. europaea]